MPTEIMFFFIAILVGLFLLFYFVPIHLYITALFSGVRVELMELVFMRIRKSPVAEIVNALIACRKAGLSTERVDLETHALAGGDVKRLAKALIKADKEEITTEFKELSSIDLAGNDPVAYVEKKKGVSMDEDLKKKLCKQIFQELTDEQLKELDRYMNGL